MKRVLVVCMFLAGAGMARAETNDERFRSLLMISGYSTAIGAAIGAALLAFTSEPGENLSYVARGAAVGFLGGATAGAFLVFSPLFIEEPWSQQSSSSQQLQLVSNAASTGVQWTFSPVISQRGVAALAAHFRLAF